MLACYGGILCGNGSAGVEERAEGVEGQAEWSMAGKRIKGHGCLDWGLIARWEHEEGCAGIWLGEKGGGGECRRITTRVDLPTGTQGPGQCPDHLTCAVLVTIIIFSSLRVLSSSTTLDGEYKG